MRSPFELDRPMYFMMAMASIAAAIITKNNTFIFWSFIFIFGYLLSAYLQAQSDKRQARVEFREYRIEMLKHERTSAQLDLIIELLSKNKTKKRGKKK